ncbi:MAG: translational GTPase TypA [Candidatus Harrisonbacteria bacterium CG10_big_fil_rev_8_21_14_0_10_44_23]|uniref:50S ribosomal subunit assembly factor BipA n=1 Tax=Candidatus Harrisonbacteria bacterium CG10_big_fil_rev_8_21_14_0_10_44_23 TaxID=1974585 RepID=A0A2H0UPP6_9BACT|nr:MAG: translational GTPase TypA [Candidatus Harrisonbacteria bacterium CG10_big_fil_rev_8_21_14_0_10_44_23]
MEIRNIAIIAHVDHGKTAITDALLRQTGTTTGEASMDSNALEKERGITIYSKNAALIYKNTKINIVDTPGHADFGSEVERILRSIDSVLLVVDAQEGPMPQTRFVLKKSLALGLKPIVVINKIDKPAADPEKTHNLVFDLFAELDAAPEQLDFPVIYAIGREGVAKNQLTDEGKDLTPLLDMILDKVPPAKPINDSDTLLAQPFNLAYDNFLGRLAIARIYNGKIKSSETVYVKKGETDQKQYRVTKLFTFNGIQRTEAEEIGAGDIGIIAGLEDVYIGDTITTDANTTPLEAIKVDEPTIELNFLVNNSPFAGRDGKFVTSRQIRERLEKELEVNVGLKVDFNSSKSGQFIVRGRGELHVAILVENMRREGYELMVSQPKVILKEIDGKTCEPFEEIIADVPNEFQGAVIEKLGKQGAVLTNLTTHQNRILLTFEGPSRGLFGYRNAFTVDTKGEGILATHFIGYRPHIGAIDRNNFGSMISQTTGKALAFSLANLQNRGTLYIGANTEVYEGMVVGNTAKGDDMTVNPTKGKELTNMRASGSDDAIQLAPARKLSIESGLEIMSEDEYLEVTPNNVRLRKQSLTENERKKSKQKSS